MLERSQMKLTVWTRIAFAGRHGIVLCYYICYYIEGGVERWVTRDEMCVLIVPVLDLTLMSERGVNVQSGC